MQLYELPFIWMPWAETLLLGLLLVISALQPRTLADSIHALSSPIQRRYNAGGGQTMVWILRRLFELSTTALSLLLAVGAWHAQPVAVTSAQTGMAMVVLLGAMLLKSIVDKWIQLTFNYSINEQTYYTYRNDLWLTLSTALLGIILLSGWLSRPLLWIAPCVVTGVYYIILWWKLMQIFGWSAQHLMMVMLYMLHAEVLPLVAAWVGIHILIY